MKSLTKEPVLLIGVATLCVTCGRIETGRSITEVPHAREEADTAEAPSETVDISTVGPDLMPYELYSFSASTCVIGDVDGGGLQDILLGAGRDSTAAYRAGRVDLYSFETGKLLEQRLGRGEARGLGVSVVRFVDITEDGIAECVVSTDGGVWTGHRVWREDGERHSVRVRRRTELTGEALILSGADLSLIASYSTEEPGDDYAQEVAVGPDIDGGGYPDLLIGAPSAETPYVEARSTETGEVIYRIDHSGGDPRRIGKKAALFLGQKDKSGFGATLCVGCDVDADGVRDFFVGAPGYEEDGEKVGAVGLYSGKYGSRLGFARGTQRRSGGWAFGAALGRLPEDTGSDATAVVASTLHYGLHKVVWSGDELEFVARKWRGRKHHLDGLGESIAAFGESEENGERAFIVGSREPFNVLAPTELLVCDARTFETKASFACSSGYTRVWEGVDWNDDGCSDVIVQEGATGMLRVVSGAALLIANWEHLWELGPEIKRWRPEGQ